MTTTIKDLKANNQGYYDRSDDAEAKGYDKHVFIAGRILQAAEMNEIQATGQRQLKAVADSLFKDGDIVRDARCVVVKATGAATLEAGAVYCNGQVRGVPKRDFNIITTGTVVIGVWLVEDVVTHTDDITLLDPATGNRGFNEPGAYRLRVEPQWGVLTDNLANGTFYPVYYVDDGDLRAKEPPPNLDAVTQAIARYDVDSNGSNYIIEGMRVTRLDDGTDPKVQEFSIAAGRARVNGFGITLTAARRKSFSTEIDLKRMTSDQLVAPKPDAHGDQLIEPNFHPIDSIDEVRILKAGTLHPSRALADYVDKLDNSLGGVNDVLKVYDQTVTYVKNVDWEWNKGSNQIRWLKLDPATSATADPAAKFPAAGSQYDVDVETQVVVTPTDKTDRTFKVKGAISDPNKITVEADYMYRLPRIDRLVVDENGIFDWIKGIATDINPVAPPVPSNLLSICEISQSWTAPLDETRIYNDGVRMVPMSTLEAMNSRLDRLTDMVAQVNLVSDINVREAGKKKGLFVDPFLNDTQRDQSTLYPQTLAVTGGALQLAIKGTPLTPEAKNASQGITGIVSCDPVTNANGTQDDMPILSNTARTSDMQVNPYMAFSPFPAAVALTPSIDRWVDTKITWTGPETRYFTITEYAPWTIGSTHGTTQTTGTTTTNELAGTSSAESEFLRQIRVDFKISGFRNGEVLSKVLFDGKDITGTIQVP
ncbi:TPA: DUF4815 domain-containing protein [Escherichia coli]